MTAARVTQRSSTRSRCTTSAIAPPPHSCATGSRPVAARRRRSAALPSSVRRSSNVTYGKRDTQALGPLAMIGSHEDGRRIIERYGFEAQEHRIGIGDNPLDPEADLRW